MSKNKSELLIDRLYRETFQKRTRNPQLRAHLMDARRFVLDDAMTAFMVDLTFQSFHARALRKHHAQPKYERLFKLLDDIRHFSRLPHRVTWVEYSHQAYMRRELEIMDEYDLDLRLQPQAFTDDIEVENVDLKRDEWIAKSKDQRIGWLFTSHSKIETCFTCTIFNCVSADSPVSMCNAGFCWDTEDNPLPYPSSHFIQPLGSRGYNTSSELATHIRGYIRPNVAFRIMSGYRKSEEEEFKRETQAHMEGIGGLIRYKWIFLSTINKIPLAGPREVKPSHGFVARGRYQKFLSHQVITLTVPQKNTVMYARKILGDLIRRRAHQVRGHWRDDYRLPKGNKSMWIAEHQRGDASLGFVTHDYSVEHKVT